MERKEYTIYKVLKEGRMKIDFDEKDKLLNLEIDEEIDHHRAEILRRNADYEIQRRNPKRVILDFNNVYFLDIEFSLISSYSIFQLHLLTILYN